VAASREFVCIRPQTYEDADEAEILSWVFSDRDGTLRNTSFGILSSDGKRKLSRTGRSPNMVYGTATEFARALREIAVEQGTADKPPIAALPELADLRLALDVATADLRPLVVAYAEDSKELARLRELLQGPAWSKPLVGRLRYVVLDGAENLVDFEELNLKPGVSVVQAEAYGRGGEILAHAGPSASAAELDALLATGLAEFDAQSKDVRAHIRDGERAGIEWETAIPVTDPGPRTRDRVR
jgi:hypothetical protein